MNRLILHLSAALLLLAGDVAHGQSYSRIGFSGGLVTNVVGATQYGAVGTATNTPPATNQLAHWWDFSDATKVTATDSRIDSVTDKGSKNITLQAGRRYYFTVCHTDLEDISAPSNEVVSKTKINPPKTLIVIP